MKLKLKKKCKAKPKLIEPQALKELRLELGMTQLRASEKLELGPKGLAAIENGRVALNRNRIEEIVNSYGLHYLDFIRVKKRIEKEQRKKKRPDTIKSVLKNSDRRSYQKIVTKECKILRSMRRVKNISQDKASSLCGYSRATIGHIENGRIEISINRAKHIVKAYGYSFSDYEKNLSKTEQRDSIIDSCLEKIEHLDDNKLELVKNLLESFN
tara:strand:- start:2437 stop:3075 length:639 start_codon:yes stop_codon:yes gene_type:complete